MVALLPTIDRFAIPPTPFLNLLTAFEQDQRSAALCHLSRPARILPKLGQSGGPSRSLSGRVFDPRRAALSDSICTGLQLANFWQDVARDYAIGRVYLPLEDLERFGCSVDDIATADLLPVFAELMRFEVERTRSLFDQGLPLVPLMPAELQADIELFARGGLAILGKIEQSNYNVLTSRPALSRWEKGSLLLSVAWRRLQAWMPGW